VEGNGFGLFEDTILTLTQRGLRKTIKTGQLVSKPSFKPRVSQTESRNINHLTRTLCPWHVICRDTTAQHNIQNYKVTTRVTAVLLRDHSRNVNIFLSFFLAPNHTVRLHQQ
jgi:hypothetical protein